jgi:hypothetical protein
MSPHITVGGSAVSAALINQITASEIYEDLFEEYMESYKQNNIARFNDVFENYVDARTADVDDITKLMRSEKVCL